MVSGIHGSSTWRGRITLAALGLALAPLSAAMAQSQIPLQKTSQPTNLHSIDVNAADNLGFNKTSVRGGFSGPNISADTASLVAHMPGAALTYNGPLAGQVQYRGLFGPRNNVLINGMHIDPGGPNWMDPPLHYLPRPMLGSLTLQRGIAPIADGIETLGATVRAESRQAGFSGNDQYHLDGYGLTGYSSVDQGFTAGGMLGVSGPNQRFDIVGARTAGGNTRTADGTLADTAYSRDNVGVDYGVRWGANTLSAQFLFDDTGHSGNPTFPMDTEFMRSRMANLRFTHALSEGHLDAQLYYGHIDHAMNNFSLRETPDFNPMMTGPDQRRVPAESDSWGLNTSWTQRVGGGSLVTGVNAYLATNSSRVTDPQMPMFHAIMFNHAKRNLYSTYAQWQGPVATNTNLMLGARYTRVQMNAGRGGVSPALPKPAQLLTDLFNGSAHNRNDNNIDLMGRLEHTLTADTNLQFSLARKTRSPSYLERYAYIPLEASAGLADGNNYVGNVALKPEVAYEADLGLAFQNNAFSITPRVFLDHIHNYITGLPINPADSAQDMATVMVSNLNGDPTPLRFSNVDAQLYGADTGWSLLLAPQWQMDGVVSYTRGLRAGSGDNIYRIAPLHGNVTLSWQPESWKFNLTETFASAQHDISDANRDPRLANPQTAGYALTDVSASYHWRTTGTVVQLGVANVFDHAYSSVLDGYNRVMDSAVPVGSRLPGAGRNFYLQLTQAF